MNAELFFPRPVVQVSKSAGATILSNELGMPSTDHKTMLDKMEHWAKERPDSVFLSEREGDGWQSITYFEFQKRVVSTAQRLLGLDVNSSSPLLVLAPNSIDHAVVAFAAMYIGVPVSPVSPAYALVAKTFERLQQVIDILKPGAVYVSDANMFERSIDSISKEYSLPIIASTGSHAAVEIIDDLVAIEEGKAQAIRKSIGPSTVAKIIFTSGSTGVPKGVLNTHEMMFSNQLALSVIWPFMNDKKPVLVDWLPWSHTFGGNVSFNSVLFHGGTLYIDNGKPAPHLIHNSVDNIKHGLPNIHLNVPAGIEALLPFLESDKEFCRVFLGGLDVLFVAAAALPQKARDRIKNAAESAGVVAPKLLAGWGSTETAPFSTSVYFDTDRADNIGVPIPGTDIKLSPNQDKFELSVKGPNVTPGYWNNESATSTAFDEDGFYRMGDAGKLIDEDSPDLGIVFDGRISENFKLASGTWVNVGALRIAGIDCLRPYCLDAVVTGHNQNDIGVILIPNVAVLAKEFSLSKEDQSLEFISKNKNIVESFRNKIEEHNQKNKTSI